MTFKKLETCWYYSSFEGQSFTQSSARCISDVLIYVVEIAPAQKNQWSDFLSLATDLYNQGK